MQKVQMQRAIQKVLAAYNLKQIQTGNSIVHPDHWDIGLYHVYSSVIMLSDEFQNRWEGIDYMKSFACVSKIFYCVSELSLLAYA